MIHHAHEMMAQNLWVVYLGIFFGPFIQEDAAVISSASLAAAGMVGSASSILLVAILGLTASDLWKYGLGMAARSRPWAARFAEGPRVGAAGKLVRGQLGKAIFVARFLPGTRIALYIAAGYFQAGFQRYAIYILASAAFLLTALFFVLKLLGEIIGDRAVFVVSLAALTGLLVLIGYKVVKAQLDKRKQAEA